MQRPLAALATVMAVVLAAGCLGDDAAEGPAPAVSGGCDGASVGSATYWLDDGYSLTPDGEPAAGSLPGNAFSSGFLTNDLTEWLSGPMPSGLVLVGDVTFEFWAENVGTPAPVVIGGDPGEAYHFFNQFGSDRTLQPSYAVEYAEAVNVPLVVKHYEETFTMPEGGFVLERGDRLRLLLTDLTLDGPDGSGHRILYGQGTPSRLTFTATCFPDAAWEPVGDPVQAAIDLPANQGLLTGAVPASEANRQDTEVQVGPGTDRITITLVQRGDRNPVKDDVDIELLVGGEVVWGIGSPYSDEAGALWRANLESIGLGGPDGGTLTVRVNSYSGVAYTGDLTISQERDAVPVG